MDPQEGPGGFKGSCNGNARLPAGRVLLRHRLLREPGGFEGFLPPKEAPNSDQLAPAHGKQDGELLVELNVAGSALQLGAPQPNNCVLQVAKLALLDLKHFPSFPGRSEPAGDLVKAPVDGALHGSRTDRLPLDSEANRWVMAARSRRLKA